MVRLYASVYQHVDQGGGPIPAVARTPRAAWIEAGLAALARGGPEAVRIEVLASDLGVTKGGFYGYFDGRSALLTEMLDEWERRSTTDVLERIEADGGITPVKMRRAGELTFSDDLYPIDLAVRSWARTNESVAERLKRVDNQRMELLRTGFATFLDDPGEIEARSALAFAYAVGFRSIAADHPGYTAEQVRRLAGDHLLRPVR